MVDVISTRLQEVYGSLRMPTRPGGTAAIAMRPVAGTTTTTAGGGNVDERMSANVLRRFGDEHRRRTAYTKEIEKQVTIKFDAP